MSDTPRTDAATLTEPFQVRELEFEVVDAGEMARLERELNEAKTRMAWMDEVILKHEITIREQGSIAQELRNELVESNADRLRLREALQRCKADADALAEAVEIMRVGICSAAMPNAAEREIASDAVKQASEVLKTYHNKYKEGNQ
jgi:chromosome segregation ATPase